MLQKTILIDTLSVNRRSCFNYLHSVFFAVNFYFYLISPQSPAVEFYYISVKYICQACKIIFLIFFCRK